MNDEPDHDASIVKLRHLLANLGLNPFGTDDVRRTLAALIGEAIAVREALRRVEGGDQNSG